MKKICFGSSILLFFFLMLFFPATVFQGASQGLRLWLQIVFPTLFPFLLVSDYILSTSILPSIAHIIGRPLALFFHVSAVSSFVILSGFLCGYPVGAKLAADLYNKGLITKKEGEYLLSFCNNLSPGFILNFIVLQNLRKAELKLPTLLILLLSPCIISFFTRRYYTFNIKHTSNELLFSPVSQTSHYSDQLDHSIISSFETLLRIGGYIILFSVIFTLIQKSPLPSDIRNLILPFLEITNGIVLLSHLSIPFHLKYILLLALSSFGGFCAIAQTGCMIRNAGFSLRRYIIEKLAASLTASLLGSLYLILFNRIIH